MRFRILVLLLLLIANVQLAKWRRHAPPVSDAPPPKPVGRAEALRALREKAWAEATRNGTTTYTFDTTFGPPPGPGR